MYTYVYICGTQDSDECMADMATLHWKTAQREDQPLSDKNYIPEVMC